MVDAMSARFRIKRHPIDEPKRSPWVLKDRRRPSWLGQYAKHEDALAAMDNVARADLGMPPRLSITRREIRDAMGANS